MAAFEIWVAPIITNQILAKVLAGPGIDVAADAVGGTVTVSHEDTSAVTDLSSNNSGNSFIQSVNFTFDTYGHVTGASAVPGTVLNADNFGQFDITDTDPGTYTWASVGSAIATNPGDTFTVLSGEGIDVDVDGAALAMRVAFVGLTAGAGLSGLGTIASPLVNTDGASTVTLTSAGGTVDLVNDGTGPALATKGLSAGAGITLVSSATECSITNSSPDQVVAITGGTNIDVTGTYPNFTVDAAAGTANAVMAESIVKDATMASTGSGGTISVAGLTGKTYVQVRVIALATSGSFVTNQDATSDFKIGLTAGSVSLTSTTYLGDIKVIIVG
jgi:hypothetical protein